MNPSARAGDISFGIVVVFLFGVFAANAGWNALLTGLTGFAFVIGGAFLFSAGRWWKYATLSLCAVAAGAAYYYAYVHWQEIHTKMPAGKQAAFFGSVTEEPKPAGNFIMAMVSLSEPYAGMVDIFVSPNSAQFHYGDEIWIRGAVSAASDPGGSPMVFLPRVRVIAHHEGLWIKEAVIGFKEHIVAEIAQLLPPDQAALLAGVMVGTIGTASAALKAQMETSGTTYIVNMYGYKIAIITFALAAALKDHLPRRVLLALTLALIMLFVFVSGGTISAIRAAIMGSFAAVARGTGRVFSARNAVTFAALGMVLMDASLLTDAGFQLSFLSFLGIYYLGPPIDRYFGWTDEGMLQWKSHAMLSLSTNLAILPIVMNTFGTFSLTSFISNILVMVPWLAMLAFGALLLFFGLFSAPLAFCAAQIVGVFLRYELFIIHCFAKFTIFMPPIFGSAVMVILYYGILIVFAYYYGAPSQTHH